MRLLLLLFALFYCTNGQPIAKMLLFPDNSCRVNPYVVTVINAGESRLCQQPPGELSCLAGLREFVSPTSNFCIEADTQLLANDAGLSLASTTFGPIGNYEFDKCYSRGFSFTFDAGACSLMYVRPNVAVRIEDGESIVTDQDFFAFYNLVESNPTCDNAVNLRIPLFSDIQSPLCAYDNQNSCVAQAAGFTSTEDGTTSCTTLPLLGRNQCQILADGSPNGATIADCVPSTEYDNCNAVYSLGDGLLSGGCNIVLSASSTPAPSGTITPSPTPTGGFSDELLGYASFYPEASCSTDPYVVIPLFEGVGRSCLDFGEFGDTCLQALQTFTILDDGSSCSDINFLAGNNVIIQQTSQGDLTLPYDFCIPNGFSGDGRDSCSVRFTRDPVTIQGTGIVEEDGFFAFLNYFTSSCSEEDPTVVIRIPIPGVNDIDAYLFADTSGTDCIRAGRGFSRPRNFPELFSSVRTIKVSTDGGCDVFNNNFSLNEGLGDLCSESTLYPGCSNTLSFGDGIFTDQCAPSSTSSPSPSFGSSPPSTTPLPLPNLPIGQIALYADNSCRSNPVFVAPLPDGTGKLCIAPNNFGKECLESLRVFTDPSSPFCVEVDSSVNTGGESVTIVRPDFPFILPFDTCIPRGLGKSRELGACSVKLFRPDFPIIIEDDEDVITEGSFSGFFNMVNSDGTCPNQVVLRVPIFSEDQPRFCSLAGRDTCQEQVAGFLAPDSTDSVCTQLPNLTRDQCAVILLDGTPTAIGIGNCDNSALYTECQQRVSIGDGLSGTGCNEPISPTPSPAVETATPTITPTAGLSGSVLGYFSYYPAGTCNEDPYAVLPIAEAVSRECLDTGEFGDTCLSALQGIFDGRNENCNEVVYQAATGGITKRVQGQADTFIPYDTCIPAAFGTAQNTCSLRLTLDPITITGTGRVSEPGFLAFQNYFDGDCLDENVPTVIRTRMPIFDVTDSDVFLCQDTTGTTCEENLIGSSLARNNPDVSCNFLLSLSSPDDCNLFSSFLVPFAGGLTLDNCGPSESYNNCNIDYSRGDGIFFQECAASTSSSPLPDPSSSGTRTPSRQPVNPSSSRTRTPSRQPVNPSASRSRTPVVIAPSSNSPIVIAPSSSRSPVENVPSATRAPVDSSDSTSFSRTTDDDDESTFVSTSTSTNSDDDNSDSRTSSSTSDSFSPDDDQSSSSASSLLQATAWIAVMASLMI